MSLFVPHESLELFTLIRDVETDRACFRVLRQFPPVGKSRHTTDQKCNIQNNVNHMNTGVDFIGLRATESPLKTHWHKPYLTSLAVGTICLFPLLEIQPRTISWFQKMQHDLSEGLVFSMSCRLVIAQASPTTWNVFQHSRDHFCLENRILTNLFLLLFTSKLLKFMTVTFGAKWATSEHPPAHTKLVIVEVFSCINLCS